MEKELNELGVHGREAVGADRVACGGAVDPLWVFADWSRSKTVIGRERGRPAAEVRGCDGRDDAIRAHPDPKRMP
jgi:hypothetical protein